MVKLWRWATFRVDQVYISNNMNVMDKIKTMLVSCDTINNIKGSHSVSLLLEFCSPDFVVTMIGSFVQFHSHYLFYIHTILAVFFLLFLHESCLCPSS